MKPEKNATGVDQFTEEPTDDSAALLSDIGKQSAESPQQQIAEPEQPTSEIVRPLVALGFAMAWPDQPLSGNEETAAADAVGKLIDKYFPDMGAIGVELNAALVIGGLVFGRVMTARATKKAANDSEKDKDKVSRGEKGKGEDE